MSRVPALGQSPSSSTHLHLWVCVWLTVRIWWEGGPREQASSAWALLILFATPSPPRAAIIILLSCKGEVETL